MTVETEKRTLVKKVRRMANGVGLVNLLVTIMGYALHNYLLVAYGFGGILSVLIIRLEVLNE